MAHSSAIRFVLQTLSIFINKQIISIISTKMNNITKNKEMMHKKLKITSEKSKNIFIGCEEYPFNARSNKRRTFQDWRPRGDNFQDHAFGRQPDAASNSSPSLKRSANVPDSNQIRVNIFGDRVKHLFIASPKTRTTFDDYDWRLEANDDNDWCQRANDTHYFQDQIIGRKSAAASNSSASLMQSAKFPDSTLHSYKKSTSQLRANSFADIEKDSYTTGPNRRTAFDDRRQGSNNTDYFQVHALGRQPVAASFLLQ